MTISLINSFQSEWLKKKRSASSWLVITGGFFIPLIVLCSLLADPETVFYMSKSPHYWEFVYNRCWPPMGMFLLPMGVILATSLVTQLEFKNNTWKQLHTTPQTLTTVFVTKLAVIISMMLQFFILFNIGFYLCGIIPTLLLNSTSYPVEAFPFTKILTGNLKFFIDCLPIIALQYLISLQFKNFLIPVGAGLGLLIASMIATSWKYGYIIPYTYCALNFQGNQGYVDPSVNFHYWAIGYFILFTALSYVLYLTKKEKG